MQVISDSETDRPRLGIVLLDLPHQTADFGLFTPDDTRGIGTLPQGWYECPASWPVPTAFAVASGAGATATVRGEPSAGEGVRAAVEHLSDFSDLIIGDCGFFWAARRHAALPRSVPTLISAVDLLEIAGKVTEREIGVLTFSAPHCEELLSKHPMRDRLRIVGVSDQPNWALLAEEDYAVNPAWSSSALERELTERLSNSRADGTLSDIGALVLECTVMPQFRKALRSVASLPIFDLASTAVALLGNNPGIHAGQAEIDERRPDAVQRN